MSEISGNKLFQFIVTIAILAIPAVFYAAPYVIYSLNKVNRSPAECINNNPNEAFCEERYFDDGHVRFSSTAHERPNCCILERLMTDTDTVSYRVLACDVLSQSQIHCGTVQSYGSNRWQIDSRELDPDLTWSGHYSQFIHE